LCLTETRAKQAHFSSGAQAVHTALPAFLFLLRLIRARQAAAALRKPAGKPYNSGFCTIFAGTIMPIYAYRCEACGFAKDVLQKISDPVLTDCPTCGKSSFRKQVTAAGFQLKGTGWYVTDFRGGQGGTNAPAVSGNTTAAASADGVAAPAATSAAPAASTAADKP
jgi:putative FmdB family regulatory protein